MTKTTFQFDIDFETQELCSIIRDAISLETQDQELRRGKIQISSRESVLEVYIDADDIVAARSLFNSLLRVMKTSFDIAKIIDSNE